MDSRPTILILGAAGGLANILSGILSKRKSDYRVIGIDSRPLKNELDFDNFTFLQMRYTRRNFEKLFRENRFEVIYHLGRISSPGGNLEARLSFSLVNTNKVLELAEKYAVKKVIFLSTFHVYGAQSDNPVFIKEDAALRASIKHAELRDVTEIDSMCLSWMWKNKDKIETVILRPCNIIGPQIQNTITKYLTSDLSPVPIDYNPMMQFIHEYDMANILFASLDKIPTGIYNVAPDEVISLQEAKSIINAKSIPFPIFALAPVTKFIKKLWVFPEYLVDYIKYSCVIDNSAISKYLDNDFIQYRTKKALSLLKKRY